MKGKTEKTVWDCAVDSVKDRIKLALEAEGKTLSDVHPERGSNLTRRLYCQVNGDVNLTLSSFLAISDKIEKTSDEYLLYGKGKKEKDTDYPEEIERLKKENGTLRNKIDELEAANRRLEKIINKIIGEDDVATTKKLQNNI